MGAEPKQLHVAFFPMMAHGHVIPTLDLARLFAARNVKATIITTPRNAHTFTQTGSPTIHLELFKFPTHQVGLPEGCEDLEQAIGSSLVNEFFKGAALLRDQLELFLEKTRPNCLVADMFFPWATDSAAKFNIPRLVFHGISLFSLCTVEVVRVHEPHKKKTVVSSEDEESITIPFLPHEITMMKSQLPVDVWENEDTEENIRSRLTKESEIKSYGVIVNSFYELEPDYSDFFRKELGRKAWNIGPVSLCNTSVQDKAQRGKQASIDEHECLKWLNSKNKSSVIYICFGSLAHHIEPQLYQIAMALEASRQEFIWVVRNSRNSNNNSNSSSSSSSEWLPRGFEQRMEGKGLIIRGWAPQVLILEHEAIGAFVTHCGWNSTLEGITSGVPMVTWPVFAEQFYNEKMVNQILKIGVSVGATKWCREALNEDVIKNDAIEIALREIMVGDEAEERRSRAKKLKDMAWKAVEEGGSSYSDLSALIDELRGYTLP